MNEILIVEDNKTFRDTLSDLLSSQFPGTRIEGAGDSEQAGQPQSSPRAALAEQAPDYPVTVNPDQPVQPLEEVERQQILQALEHFGGNRQRTAQALGIGVRTLGLKLKRWKEQNLVGESV